jgi:hypothetical protein
VQGSERALVGELRCGQTTALDHDQTPKTRRVPIDLGCG